MNEANPILSEFNHVPMMVCETQLPWLQTCADQLALEMPKLDELTNQMGADDGFWSSDPNSFLSRVRPYNVQNGILHIPVKGVLMNKFPFSVGSMGTGYTYIWQAVKRGLGDDNVKGIALMIDSGGGHATGLFDLVDRIYARRDEKPINAFVDTRGYSAAYAIASLGRTITVERSGGVGSIGVIIAHMEMSKRAEQLGYTITNIRSKARKAEGGPFEPLSEVAQARMQASVEHTHKEFVALVARNRGMDEAAVDATDALTFLPHEAIQNGLADKIGVIDDALTAFVASFDSDEGEDLMADNTKADTVLKTDHEAALAAATDSSKTAGIAEGKDLGVAEERARITAILSSDEGKARPASAMMMVELGIDAEKATAQLAKLPEEAKAAAAPEAPKGAGAPNGMLEAAMGGTKNPELGASTGEPETEGDKRMAQLSADIKNMGLPGFKVQ